MLGLGLLVWLLLSWSQVCSIQAQASTTLARVDYAKSGHTLELLYELSPQMPVMEVRLAGIQAPDIRQEPWGQQARQCLTDLVDDEVRIESHGIQPDQYNRLWANVWAEGRLLNAALLARGCAYLDSDRLSAQRYGTDLIHAQEEARLLGRGIWSPEAPLRQTSNSFRQTLPDP